MASPNNMIYQEGYFPPPPPPSGQQADQRRRSSSYTDRYRPRNYSSPPPQQPDPNLLSPYQQPQAGLQAHLIPLPASGPSTPYQQPPYPTDDQALVPRYDMPIIPQRQLADELPPRPTVMYPEGLRRASYDADGAMRRNSHESRRSHHSHHSHRSRRSRFDDEDLNDDSDSERDGRHHHHHHHERGENIDELESYRKKKRERGDNVSRSFGGSLVSVFGQPIKWLIEPRDKY